MKYLGIDIGGTAVKMGIVTHEGEILETGSYDVAFDNYKTPILDTVLQKTEVFLKEQNLSASDLSGIGISATGQIDSQSGTVIGTNGNIKNWLGSNIKSEFEDKFHLKTRVINDANSVAIGESWLGKGKGYKNIVVITIGTGVGGGVLIDSNILLGHRGIAGELGHISIDRNGLKCTCGNNGCYEMYASMTALNRMVIERIDELKPYNISINEEEINGRVIFELLEKGNPVIEDIVHEWIDNVVTGLVGLTHTFNPEIIVIGGGVSAQEELFISKVREKVKAKTMKQFGKDLKVEAASLKNNAGLVGAVHYCMHH